MQGIKEENAKGVKKERVRTQKKEKVELLCKDWGLNRNKIGCKTRKQLGNEV